MKRSILGIALTLTACGTAASPAAPPEPQGIALLGGMKIDPAPANGLQIVMPVVKGLPPSSSQEWCTWTDQVADHDLDVKEVDAFQTKTGHHVVLFYTNRKQPAGTTRECTDDDMTTFRFVSASGGEGGQAALPGNLVARIPKGSQIVANHHYLNATGDTIDAQSAVNVRFADPNAVSTRTSALTWLDTQMRAPPGRSTFDVRCTMKNDVALWLLQPHMHAWGEHILVERTRGGEIDRMVDVDWDPAFVFHPPEMRKDPSAPYVLRAGDEIHVQCTWNNTTGKDLGFGLEMCVAFGQTVDTAAAGNMMCDAGRWGTF